MNSLNLFPVGGMNGIGNKPYVIDGNDSRFIHTVKNLISSNYYQEMFTLDNHLMYLESLRKKLSMMLVAETHSGLMNWGLREQVTEVNGLHDQLQKLRRMLFDQL